MKYLILMVLCILPIMAEASCKYEARIRLGLVWHNVTITSSYPLSRNQVINRLSDKYNFHDVGDIYSNCN